MSSESKLLGVVLLTRHGDREGRATILCARTTLFS